ncbi:MAG: IS30 family transposase, partial [Rubritalea sp.]
WERGLSENTNGLIRQYFPRRTDFGGVTDDQIAEVEIKLNSRPRKVLDRKTPNFMFLTPN